MKRASRAQFFILAVAIFAFAYLSFFGASNHFGMRRDVFIKGANDITLGIDIRGGVEAVFTPAEVDLSTVTREDMDAARAVLEHRLMAARITDNEVFVDHDNRQILVRFPLAAGEHDVLHAIDNLGETAILTFVEGSNRPTQENVILLGHEHVTRASAQFRAPHTDAQGRHHPGGHVVVLNLNSQGAGLFEAATRRLAPNGSISIWMDDEMVSDARVNEPIPGGEATISSPGATQEWAQQLANQINSGALPFRLSVDSPDGGMAVNIIDPTMGSAALNTMLLAALIGFILLCIIMILIYKIPGIIACIALIGQAAGIIASVSGFVPTIDSFTLTIPGIAGIILSIGMGVDANVITSERIREELKAGRTIDGAIDAGFKSSWSAIFDGNITVIIVSVILMGAFGPPDGMAASIVSPLMFMFSSTATGFIYSFGYTLLWGVIMNFIMAVFASRIMLRGVSKIKFLRKAHLYGGVKNAE